MATTRRLLALSAGGLALLGAAVVSAQDDRSATVSIVQVDGVLDAAYAGHIVDEVRHAEREGYAAVVLRLDSSGSVKVDVDRLVRTVRDATVPVAAWVGPNHATVAGTATAVWLAADLRFLAPNARVRDHPAPRSAATGLAGTLPDTIRALDGQRVGERTLRIDAQAAVIRFASPGVISDVRHALANPWLAYLLLVCGLGALVFEACYPGFGPAGYSGVLGAALGAYALTMLPIRPALLGLTLAGIAAMAFDVSRNHLGRWTWVGLSAFTGGSVFLVHGNTPAGGVPLWAVAVGAVGSLLFYVVVMTVVLRSLRGRTPGTGLELVGAVGEVRSPLNPQGHVIVDGALWRAQALEWDGAVATGTRVTVTGVDERALVLEVQPVADGS